MHNPLRLTAVLLIAGAVIFAGDTRAAEIDSTRMSRIVKVLASDEFEGRAPGGPGEALTVLRAAPAKPSR
jgi:hypothetical protein